MTDDPYDINYDLQTDQEIITQNEWYDDKQLREDKYGE